VDAATDLIPGLYEGGLKTWEGGVDLVEVLSEGLAGGSDWLKGKSVLEVCPSHS
jgi:protein-histidine N-methyltransferase